MSNVYLVKKKIPQSACFLWKFLPFVGRVKAAED